MREDFADNPMALYGAAMFDAMAGNLDAAEATMRQAVSAVPDLSAWGAPTAQVLLGWVAAQSGLPDGREQLERLRQVRTEQVEGQPMSSAYHSDLVLIASVLGDEDEQLRWFLEATRLDRRSVWYVLRNAPWLDHIRHRPEFRAWLSESEERMAAQRGELAVLGPWTPEAVLGGEGG